MLIVFVIVTLLFSFITYELIKDVVMRPELNYSIWITKQSEQNDQKIEIYVCWILQMPFILSCLAIIELKGTKDCI